MIQIERDNFEAISEKWFGIIFPKNNFNKWNAKVDEQNFLLKTAKFLKSEKNLRSIILGLPETIYDISIKTKRKFPDMYPKIRKRVKGEEREVDDFSKLNKLFDYKNIIKQKGYFLSHELKINVCPYCNRNHTFTVGTDKEKTIRPTFDHFFNKTKNPLLALSFYNLIPSCHQCNSNLKLNKDFEFGTHFHPYFNGFGEENTFNYLPKNYNGVFGGKDIKVILESDIPSDIKIKNAKKVFKHEKI
jgi:hypothetical protein